MTDTTPDRRRGVWISHRDGTEVTPHSSEVAALRDAVSDSKQVTFVPYGSDLLSATLEQPPAGDQGDGTEEVTGR